MIDPENIVVSNVLISCYPNLSQGKTVGEDLKAATRLPAQFVPRSCGLAPRVLPLRKILTQVSVLAR
jgi:hypothetical protein